VAYDTKLIVFVNGVIVGYNEKIAPNKWLYSDNASKPVRINQDSVNATKYPGKLAVKNVKHFNSVLSPVQVVAEYNATLAPAVSIPITTTTDTTLITNGLVFYAKSSEFTANCIIRNQVSATNSYIYGCYMYTPSSKLIRLGNDKGIFKSCVKLHQLENIRTISIWYYMHTINATRNRTYIDGRSGKENTVFTHAGVSGKLANGNVYVNNNTTPVTTKNASTFEVANAWRNVTIVLNEFMSTALTLFGNFTHSECVDVTLGPIIIYNRPLTVAEIGQNYTRVLATLPNISNNPVYSPAPVPSSATNQLSALLQKTMANVKGAYSLKLLVPSYSGPMVRVMKSSTNEAMDFFGDAIGNLGSGPLASGTSLAIWLGTSTGYVQIWYDQARLCNLVNSMIGKMPAIVLHNSVYRLLFETNYAAFLSPQVLVPNTTEVVSQPFTLYVKSQPTKALSTNNTSNNKFVFAMDGGAADAGVGVEIGTNGVALYEKGTNYYTKPYIYNYVSTNATSSIYISYNASKVPTVKINETNIRTGVASSRANLKLTRSIGLPSNWAWNSYFKGHVDDLVIWNTAI
jgi:hypothetical protein